MLGNQQLIRFNHNNSHETNRKYSLDQLFDNLANMDDLLRNLPAKDEANTLNDIRRQIEHGLIDIPVYSVVDIKPETKLEMKKIVHEMQQHIVNAIHVIGAIGEESFVPRILNRSLFLSGVCLHPIGEDTKPIVVGELHNRANPQIDGIALQVHQACIFNLSRLYNIIASLVTDLRSKL